MLEILFDLCASRSSNRVAFRLACILALTVVLSFKVPTNSMSTYIQRSPRFVSMSLAEKKAQLPLKIAVAGGGVGGVMLAYALQKKGFDVTVFEKAKKFSRFGGPIQLASNALSCVNSLSPELFEQIMGR